MKKFKPNAKLVFTVSACDEEDKEITLDVYFDCDKIMIPALNIDGETEYVTYSVEE